MRISLGLRLKFLLRTNADLFYGDHPIYYDIGQPQGIIDMNTSMIGLHAVISDS